MYISVDLLAGLVNTHSEVEKVLLQLQREGFYRTIRLIPEGDMTPMS